VAILVKNQAGNLPGFRREELQLGVHNLGEESALRLGKEWEFALIVLSAGKISAQPSVVPPSVLSAACPAMKKTGSAAPGAPSRSALARR